MPAPGSRIALSLGITALVLPMVVLGIFVGSFATATGFSAGDTSSPIAGASFYVDPDSSAHLAAAAAAAGDPDSDSAATLTRLAAQPSAIWLLPETYPLSTVQADVTAIAVAAAAAGQVPVFVLYGIPERDCDDFSAGGLSEAEYPTWVSSIAAALTAHTAVVILEPDALALAQDCGNVDQRVAQIRQGVSTFAGTNATVYLDAGHSDWIDARTMAGLLNRAGVQSVRGFATNVSNYNDSAAERAFGATVSALTGGAHFVVDTSRNGAGSTDEWCNPAGRALGSAPAPTSDGGLRDADLWVKAPGESDGSCNDGPPAGQWWNDRALELAAAAGW